MVILELKFTNRFPDWFKELVRIFGLAQCGAAKYAGGVELMGEHRLTNTFAVHQPAQLPRPAGELQGTPTPPATTVTAVNHTLHA